MAADKGVDMASENSKKIINNSAPAVLLCIALGLGFYFYSYKKEKNSLLRELELAAKQRNELSLARDEVMKSIAPLKEEIQRLQTIILQEKHTRESQSVELSAVPAQNAALTSRAEINTPEEKNKKEPARGPYLAKDKIMDTEKGLTRLREYVKSLEEEKASLKEKADQLKVRFDEKERDLSLFASDNAGLKDTLTKLTQSKNKLESELSLNAVSLDKIRSELSVKESQVTAFNKTRQNLEEQIHELNNKSIAFSSINANLERQLTQYRQEKSFLEKELEKAKEDLGRQNGLFGPLNRKVDELTGALDNQEKQLSATSLELYSLRESRKNLEIELSQLKAAKSANENQITQLNARIQDSTFSYESLKNTVSQLSSLLTKKEVEISERQRELVSLKDDLDSLLKQKNTLLATLKEKEKVIEDMNISFTRMGSQIVALQEQLDAPNRLQSKTLEQLEQLTSVSNFLQDRISGISKDLSTIHTQADLDKKKAEELRRRVEVTLDIQKEEPAVSSPEIK